MHSKFLLDERFPKQNTNTVGDKLRVEELIDAAEL